jgi:ribose 5-phosphate isomerase
VKGGIIGVGTGSTVNHFIDYLATVKGRIDGAVSAPKHRRRGCRNTAFRCST